MDWQQEIEKFPMIRKAAWKITELSTGHFIAEATEDNTLCYPERRVYFSRHSLEQDFGQLTESAEIQQIKYI